MPGCNALDMVKAGQGMGITTNIGQPLYQRVAVRRKTVLSKLGIPEAVRQKV